MALGSNSGPAGLPPHQTDHGASGDVPAELGPHHDITMLGQTGHAATNSGGGYEIGGRGGHVTKPPVGPPLRMALGDEYDRGF